jgi:hypothetical protein
MPTIASSTIAPIVETTSLPQNPAKPKFSRFAINAPRKAPMTPTTRFAIRPCLRPLTCSTVHSASVPMTTAQYLIHQPAIGPSDREHE